jgi:hypothetical protein
VCEKKFVFPPFFSCFVVEMETPSSTQHVVELRLVVALTRNERGIGIQGKLPWKLKKDLQFFKELTLGNAVRRTYPSYLHQQY